MSAMTTIAATAGGNGRYLGAPKLRLLASGERPRFERPSVAAHRGRRSQARDGGAAAAAPALAPEAELAQQSGAPVLVAGRDASRRAGMIEELEQTMASDTKFVHASAFWEVLVLAGSSRLVILSGDLDEVPTESLMRMLSHRYPALPVVALDTPATALAQV
jgi:hypothetical protein